MPETPAPELNKETSSSNKFFDFFNLSPAEEERLKGQLEESGGTARLIVHPFYRDPFRPSERGTSSRWQRVGDALKQWVGQDTKNAPPLFVMQEAKTSAEAQWRAEFANTEVVNRPYIVSTEIGRPHPVMHGEQEAEQRAKLGDEANEEIKDSAGIPNATREKNVLLEKQRAGSWKIFIDKLKKCGVQKLIIGGNLLVARPENYTLSFDSAMPDIEKLAQCVGESYGRLAEDFAVDLSLLSSPHNRWDVKRVSAAIEEMNKLRQHAARGLIDREEAREKFKILKNTMISRIVEAINE